MRFAILTRPRSGSHMLASALDSHPDIQCYGERRHARYPWLGDDPGRVEGWIVHLHYVNKGLVNLDEFDRLIVLVRDLTQRKRRLHEATDTLHITGPETRPLSDQPTQEKGGTVDDLMNASMWRTSMVVSYEDLTGNQDTRYLPAEHSYNLCAFLGVDPMILETKFHKPGC